MSSPLKTLISEGLNCRSWVLGWIGKEEIAPWSGERKSLLPSAILLPWLVGPLPGCFGLQAIRRGMKAEKQGVRGGEGQYLLPSGCSWNLNKPLEHIFLKIFQISHETGRSRHVFSIVTQIACLFMSEITPLSQSYTMFELYTVPIAVGVPFYFSSWRAVLVSWLTSCMCHVPHSALGS